MFISSSTETWKRKAHRPLLPRIHLKLLSYRRWQDRIVAALGLVVLLFGMDTKGHAGESDVSYKAKEL